MRACVRARAATDRHNKRDACSFACIFYLDTCKTAIVYLLLLVTTINILMCFLGSGESHETSASENVDCYERPLTDINEIYGYTGIAIMTLYV